MSTRPEADWHVDDAALRAYADGTLDFAAEASVEAHLLACAACRTLVAPATEPQRLEAVWNEVVDAIDVPRASLLERFLLRSGVDGSTARLLGATPSLTTAWLGSVTVALFFAIVAAHSSSSGTLVFLLLAPVLPVAGVAAAYGPHADPAYDVAMAAPYSSFRLLMLRSAAVLATTALLAAAAAALLPTQAWLAVGWLLPALALTGATLALATRFDAVWSAGAVTVVWLTAVFTAFRETGALYAAFSAAGQLVCLAVAAASFAVLVGRHHTLSFDSGRTP